MTDASAQPLEKDMMQKQIVSRLKGIFPPLVTTFNRRGDLDEGAYRANLRRYAGLGLAGVLVTGSTGEAPYLSEHERLRLVDLARAAVKPPELLLVGTGLESTRETIRLSREAIARGADAILVVTPNYYKPRMETAALIAHYRAVADAVRKPVLIYSIPQFTGIRMGVDSIGPLTRHPNIVGLKESSGDLGLVKAIVAKRYSSFRVLVGAALILIPAMEAGATGGVLAQACFAPELCVAVYRAFERGDNTKAEKLADRLGLLVRAISGRYGVAGIKAAMEIEGYGGGAPRLPLLPLRPSDRREVAQALAIAREGLEI